MNLLATPQRKRLLGVGLTVLLVSVCYWQFTTPRPTPPRPRPPGWVATSGLFNHVFLQGRWLVWNAYPLRPTPDPQYGDFTGAQEVGAYDLQAQQLLTLTNHLSDTVVGLVGDEVLLDRPVAISPTSSTVQHLRLNFLTGAEQMVDDELEWRNLTGKLWDFWMEPYPASCQSVTEIQDICGCGKEIFAKKFGTDEVLNLGSYRLNVNADTNYYYSNELLKLTTDTRPGGCGNIKSYGPPIELVDLESLEYRVLSPAVYMGSDSFIAALVGRTLVQNIKEQYMRVFRVTPQQPIEILLTAPGYAQGLAGENILLYTPNRWVRPGLAALDLQSGATQLLDTDTYVKHAGGDENHVFWIAAGHPQQLFVAPLHLQPPATPLFAGTPSPTFPPEFLEPRPLPVWLTATPWRTTPTPAP